MKKLFAFNISLVVLILGACIGRTFEHYIWWAIFAFSISALTLSLVALSVLPFYGGSTVMSERVSDENTFESKARNKIALEYGTTWQGLADSCADRNRATDILMDLASTEAELLTMRGSHKALYEALEKSAEGLDMAINRFRKMGIMEEADRYFPYLHAVDAALATAKQLQGAAEQKEQG